MFSKPVYIPDETIQARYKASASNWLRLRQEKALAAFPGFPSTHVEQWKYTNVKSLLSPAANDIRPNQGDISAAAAALDALPAGPRIVFVNGRYHTALSDVPAVSGLDVEPLSKILTENPALIEPYLGVLSAEDDKNGFASASLVLAEDGIVIKATGRVNQPLTIAHIYTSEHCYTRNIIILDEGASLHLTEVAIGVPGAHYAAVGATEIFLAPQAELIHTLVQCHSAEGAEINSRYVRQEQESRYHGIAFTTGAKVNRIEAQVLLKGPKAHTAQHTVQLLRDARHGDSTTRITHDTVEATSSQHCRMILDDQAKGTFQGKTVVGRHAQKTDGRQLNKNLLLSRHAQANTKPELEIYADDVKCSHGATTGELDAKALFYLQSRGIDPGTARRLLVEAFADEVIEETPVSEELKDYLRARVADWMHHG